MTDVVDKQTRSRMMGNIRGTNTRPEIAVRRALHAAGLRYRLHIPNLPGKPDIVLRRHKLCIFVHGCFWHRHVGCKFTTTPGTRAEFWQEKFKQNVLRDRAAIESLQQQGWRVFILWECGIRKRSLDWLPAAVISEVEWLEWPLLIKLDAAGEPQSNR
ncbi:DNA mismatch endonuclease Vsr [Burkholderia cenocepacia]|uniref:very short patch repair endonuclease n=1 Tax=Burkholderia cenocepacia TaxID=95486 RepID=UPI000F5800BA|nr:very short patch repair endonuclease [Burkholderia cenocepacia]MBR8311381.1 DNA mismatch endonuclease Vsr [Burkholderia cenocepacia]RQU72622.1 DNA mismatch endonuclease Vsr [Burkholderia cenocepacia]RQV01362.1 DNA mismatch endonuclease Vsr [Burkholderia cenocepacia]